MKIKGIIVSLFALVLGAAALAGEEHRMRVELAVDGDDGKQHFSFDSRDAGFELHDMQVGESRTITGESGQTALVTRTEDGFEFNVDGEIIKMGDMAKAVDYTMVHERHGDDVQVNVDEDIHVSKAVKLIKIDDAAASNVVTIITDDALDETTKQQIRDVLSSSGHTGDVTFIDTTGLHGDHAEVERVHIITKEVDVTN